MSDPIATLDDWIKRIRAIPQLGKLAAPAVAEAIRAELAATTAAGTTPDGTPWEPKKSGGRALANAGNRVAVMPIGPFVVVKLRGAMARHHLGRARGQIVRQVIPVDALSPRMAEAVRAVLVTEFQKLTGGVT